MVGRRWSRSRAEGKGLQVRPVYVSLFVRLVLRLLMYGTWSGQGLRRP